MKMTTINNMKIFKNTLIKLADIFLDYPKDCYGVSACTKEANKRMRSAKHFDAIDPRNIKSGDYLSARHK